jgi:hypothetical protein
MPAGARAEPLGQYGRETADQFGKADVFDAGKSFAAQQRG